MLVLHLSDKWYKICGQDLNKHISSVHEGIKYQCTLCGTKYKHLSSLSIHTKSKHGSIQFSCNICQFSLNFVISTNQPNLSLYQGSTPTEKLNVMCYFHYFLGYDEISMTHLNPIRYRNFGVNRILRKLCVTKHRVL